VLGLDVANAGVDTQRAPEHIERRVGFDVGGQVVFLEAAGVLEIQVGGGIERVGIHQVAEGVEVADDPAVVA
jgi:hypothetical protein